VSKYAIQVVTPAKKVRWYIGAPGYWANDENKAKRYDPREADLMARQLRGPRWRKNSKSIGKGCFGHTEGKISVVCMDWEENDA
jgi:hypothetical protein